MTVQIRMLRKASTKTIMETRVKAPDVRTFLYRIAGRITGYVVGESDNGPWVKFKGAFQVQRNDGQLFNAPAAFIPQPFQDMLEAKLNEMHADGEVASVEFGVDIYVNPDESSVTGYTYEGVPILKPSDESESIMARLNAATPLPQLEAPKAQKAAKK